MYYLYMRQLVGPWEMWQYWLVKFLSGEYHRISLVNIGLGNGLVPSGNKPLPEPMLTQIYVVVNPDLCCWCHSATLS